MSNILSSVPLVRVKFKRTVNNITVSADHVTAEPTVSYLTVPGQHGFIDLVTVTSQIDPSDATTGYIDLVATDDTDVLETFGWTIRFLNSTRPTRVVAVPQSGTGVTTIVDFGQNMPSVWLDSLATFTGPSGATGSDLATRTYVDGALDAHEAATDPHPQYALDSDLAAVRQIPTGGTSGQVLQASGGGAYAWVTGAGSNLAPIATSGSASDLSTGTVGFGRLPVGTSGSTVAAGNDSRLLGGQLTPTTVFTSNSHVPVHGEMALYDPSQAGTPANIALTLAVAAAGQRYEVVNLAPITTSWALTLTCQGSDTFASGGTAMTLAPGDRVTLVGSAGKITEESRTVGLYSRLREWVLASAFRLVSATRDANSAITTGSIVWPDGATGTFTTTTASTAFPGAVDAYTASYVPLAGATRTVTQPAVTRDAAGAVTAQPALAIA